MRIEMRRLVTKVLLLFAVLLMPLGMAPAAAGAAHHPTAAAMPEGHCDEQAPKQGSEKGLIECTMVCSSALPAADLPHPRPLLLACAPEMSGVTQMLRGLQPETATPPPKRS